MNESEPSKLELIIIDLIAAIFCAAIGTAIILAVRNLPAPVIFAAITGILFVVLGIVQS